MAESRYEDNIVNSNSAVDYLAVGLHEYVKKCEQLFTCSMSFSSPDICYEMQNILFISI